ncbi:protein GAMETOPHYTE DEFECTIVE 1-like isoform X2 [Brassica napus]|uniref:protein GAMETOPHYTE DEFECTIVE 1-like isoform X2 n=1 Tax=Brassica napus TaxID=3708 RepID=UPI00207896AD|nr:protein GAMETOPHYTE DEFECTIVE 1-like isoform X2 [Brassica napus]
MGFFDLNVPYSYPSQSGGKEVAVAVAVANKLRVKLATKAMELGYVGIAHNHSIGGVMTEKDSCTIPLLTLGSFIKAAPRLSSSVAFHRGLLGVPRSTPFRQYTRVTVKLESKAQCLGLNSGNPVLKSYDIVAVRPMNQFAFDQACTKAEVDIISIDFSNLPFRLMHPTVKAAIKRGVYFEIKYSDLLKDAEKRRQVISNAKLLVDWTKGKNLIISSGSPSVTELRGPNDVINLMSLLGLSTERARAAVSKNCRNMIAKILKKKRFHKEAVKVELLSSSDTFSLEQTLSGDFMKWDPISSGEGDMLLEDLAKAFDATTRAVANKSSKAIDVTSDRKGLPSHGFRLTDILGSEPSTQETADKMIDDAPVHCKSQVSDACMADSASSVDNLLENETVSQIEISEDDNKVEPTTIVPLRKCSTSQGQGLLVQDQAPASFTLIRCTKSDAASDGNMQTELESEDKSVSPSKIGHVVPQSLVENLKMETILVHDEVSLEEVSKEEVISDHAKIEHSVSIDGDEMEIDGSLEANHDEYMEVTVEDQKHETDNSLSPEAAGQDHDQVPSLDSSEAELGEEPAVPYNNTIEISMEDKKESGREIETNQQVHVQSERNNVRNSGKVGAKRSRTRLTQLQPLKPFLLHRFKQISKRRKHRRG